jgi:NADH-quinone oxidoreductase subunit L
MNLLWAVMLLPLIGAFLNGIVLRRASKTVSHVVGALVMVTAFVCAVALFISFMGEGGVTRIVPAFDWIRAGDFEAPFRYIIDRLSMLMVLIITGIGSLIHIYAGGYMHEEDKTWRFFSYLNLFVFMMLQLVLGDNLLVMFIGWEGVGLCSYLLIGYWYHEEQNAIAGMKAFVVNRIGDIGFLIGIFLTFKFFGTVSFSDLKELIMGAQNLTTAQIEAISWITLSFFIGACGKSAQLPLYVWLPDAMAGPTPVSALIHAATMVTAGVYMMARMHFMYYLAPNTQFVVMIVGAVTALFAATIALVQRDIKKVLAYSTVSQLGYMVLACGLGAYSAGVFHLLTHACFKALLFLGAGSVIVALHHKQDMKEMGGLRKHLPMTHITMLMGLFAIIGFPGFSGFFSKDEILWKAWIGGGKAIWAIAALAAVCTSFYMVRLFMLTFYGKFRGDHHTESHLHETSWIMWAPLVVLAALSAGIGFLNIPPIFHGILPGTEIFHHYLTPVIQMPPQASEIWSFLTSEHSHAEEWMVMGLSVLGMIIASSLAIVTYRNGFGSFATMLHAKFPKIHSLLENKYYVDEIYDAYIVTPLKDMSLFLWKIVDVTIIDGIVNGFAQACAFIAGITSFRMSGSLHRHAMVMIMGLVCMLAALVF